MDLTAIPLEACARAAAITSLNLSENRFACVRGAACVCDACDRGRSSHASLPTPLPLPSFPGNLERFTALHTLILDKNGLASLAGAPVSRTVRTLWLNNNAFADLVGTLDAIAATFPGVTYLSLMRNPASPPLVVASEADLAAAARYRLYVLHRLPQLEFLDAAPVAPAERAEARVKGAFCAPKKPTAAARPAAAAGGSGSGGGFFGLFGWGGDAAAPAAGAAATPTGDAGKPAPAPEKKKASTYIALGTTRYDGRHSEGNRFIVDKDL
jgi:hypothetical protein